MSHIFLSKNYIIQGFAKTSVFGKSALDLREKPSFWTAPLNSILNGHGLENTVSLWYK